ncbi:hypothetical protein [Nostoc sp.]|uniref:hypothetical protein n=1 Tax=Nostoc sp. TaxID=1180 RepID=UPI002FFB51F3
MPTQKTRNYSCYVNYGKEEDAMNRVSTRGDRFCDRIPILIAISVLLGAIAFPGLWKYRTR